MSIVAIAWRLAASHITGLVAGGPVRCVGIVCTLLLMVTEKGKEIAILKAIGASDGAIMRVFMLEGVIIGGIGTVAGVATALATCTGLSWFGVRLEPEPGAGLGDLLLVAAHHDLQHGLERQILEEMPDLPPGVGVGATHEVVADQRNVQLLLRHAVPSEGWLCSTAARWCSLQVK